MRREILTNQIPPGPLFFACSVACIPSSEVLTKKAS